MQSLTIIGFGNQAKAWALNLRDSNIQVNILSRSGKSFDAAKKMGFQTYLLDDFPAHVLKTPLALLVPDQSHLEVVSKLSQISSGPMSFILAHGYSFTYDKIAEKFPQHNFILFAPKAIASEMRFMYETKGNLGAVYCLDAAKECEYVNEDWIKDLAGNLGITKGPYPTSFKNETDADLFSEQTLLCGLYPFAIDKVFNHLVANGVEPETAYFECFEESYLIIKALNKLGPEKFFNAISPNALIGAKKGKEILINQDFDQAISKLWNQISNGDFSNEINQKNSYMNALTEIQSYWRHSELNKTHRALHKE